MGKNVNIDQKSSGSPMIDVALNTNNRDFSRFRDIRLKNQ